VSALRTTRPLRIALSLAGVACLAAGCATTAVTAQWSDPEFKGRSLRGQSVLVVCDGDSPATKRICQDEIAAQVRAAGATPVIGPESAQLTAGPPPANDQTIAAARAAGAKAILASTVGPDATFVSGGSSVGFGVGGFGGSGGRTVSGGGVSIGIPIGGAQAQSSYAASMTLTDVATVRMMWSSKVTTPTAQSANAQIADLARVGVEAARGAGFF
jgi:hypothetical protein